MVPFDKERGSEQMHRSSTITEGRSSDPKYSSGFSAVVSFANTPDVLEPYVILLQGTFFRMWQPSVQ